MKASSVRADAGVRRPSAENAGKKDGQSKARPHSQASPLVGPVWETAWAGGGTERLAGDLASMPLVQRQSAVRSLQRTRGNSFVERLAVQAKLMVGPAGDRYENEADAVSDQVMRSIEAGQESIQKKPLAASITPLVQRLTGKILRAGHMLQRQEDEEEIQTKPGVQCQSDGSFEAGGHIEHRLHARKGSGRPLASDALAHMESGFGADFSGVRVHTDDEAAQLNRSLSARSFTYGNEIYFGAGQYNPGARSGMALIAHELAHVIQQGAGRVKPGAVAKRSGTAAINRQAEGGIVQRETEEEKRKRLGLSPRPTTPRPTAPRPTPTTRRPLPLPTTPRPTTTTPKTTPTTKPSMGKKVLKQFGKGGLGVLEGLAKTIFGPLTYLRFFSKKQRENWREDTVEAEYGSGSVATAAKVLATITKTVEEVGMVTGWAGLILSIVGAALTAAAMGAGAPLLAASSILGIIGLACAAFAFVARSVLMIGNIVRLKKYNPSDPAKVRAQAIKDGLGILGSTIGILTGGLGVGNVSLIGLSSDATKTVGQTIAESGVGQAITSVGDFATESVQTKRIQRDTTGQTSSGPGQGSPAEDDLKALGDLKEVAGDLAGLGRDQSSLADRKMSGLAEAKSAVAESLPKAQEGFAPLIDAGSQVQQASQMIDKGASEAEEIDSEKNAIEAVADVTEAGSSKADKASQRDPASIKPDEIKAAQASSSQPPKKRSLLRRAGGAVKSFFRGLMKRLFNVKRMIQKIFSKVKNKIVQMVVKAMGAEKPTADFLSALKEADTGIPQLNASLAEQKDAAGSQTSMAEQLKNAAEGIR